MIQPAEYHPRSGKGHLRTYKSPPSPSLPFFTGDFTRQVFLYRVPEGWPVWIASLGSIASHFQQDLANGKYWQSLQREITRSGYLLPGSFPAKSAQVDFLTGQYSYKASATSVPLSGFQEPLVPFALSLNHMDGNRLPAVSTVRGLYHPLQVSLNLAHTFLDRHFLKILQLPYLSISSVSCRTLTNTDAWIINRRCYYSLKAVQLWQRLQNLIHPHTYHSSVIFQL